MATPRHVKPYGALAHEPISEPFARKSTLLMLVPLAGVALALKVTVPGAASALPPAGALSVTDGGTLFTTATATAVDVPLRPWRSYAFAVSESAPTLGWVQVYA